MTKQGKYEGIYQSLSGYTLTVVYMGDRWYYCKRQRYISGDILWQEVHSNALASYLTEGGYWKVATL